MKRGLLFLPFAILFLLACQISEEESINQILDRRGEALQKKDLALYLSCISKRYHDKNETIDRLQNRIKGYFESFDRIDYASWDRSIRIEGDTAKAIQEFHLEVQKGTKKNRYAGKETLFFKKEGKEWKITGGL